MELEDIGLDHPVWDEADEVIESIHSEYGDVLK
jgi:hypothetical protein